RGDGPQPRPHPLLPRRARGPHLPGAVAGRPPLRRGDGPGRRHRPRPRPLTRPRGRAVRPASGEPASLTRTSPPRRRQDTAAPPRPPATTDLASLTCTTVRHGRRKPRVPGAEGRPPGRQA